MQTTDLSEIDMDTTASFGEAANGESDNVYWSSAEVDRLIQGWERSAEAVNLSRNESAMQEIANFVGSGKTAKQVRMKLKKLRVRYIQEKEALLGPGTNVSKWRFFSKLDRFGDKIPKNMVKNKAAYGGSSGTSSFISPQSTPRRDLSDFPSTLTDDRGQRSSGQREGSTQQSAIINSLATIIKSQQKNQTITDMPPLYPFDPDVPINVAIDDVWNVWNSSLQYPLTDNGIRTLIRSGFRDISHLELLKKKAANINLLHMNYHDRLALEVALETNRVGSQQYEVVTNDDGAVIEVRGCTHPDEGILLTAEGQKLLEWNKSTCYPLSDIGLGKVMNSGFGTSDDIVLLITQDEIDLIDLSPRDRAALQKIISDNKTAQTAAVSS